VEKSTVVLVPPFGTKFTPTTSWPGQLPLINSHTCADNRPVRLAYQPPASSTFLSEQISHQEPASSTFLLEQNSTSHQPNQQADNDQVYKIV
jgi:hypothetical protein